jgi:hypothetical protein
MSQSYDYWREAALVGTYTPLPDSRLSDMYTETCKYGSGNGWTGTTGNLCTMIRELLREVEHLRHGYSE